MSALSNISNYGNISSEESDSECSEFVQIRQKLPPPKLEKLSRIEEIEAHQDNPELHSGRIRSFPHVRGNWATFVYVKYSEDSITHLINKLQKLVLAIDASCVNCDDLHLSLSKTVVLQYHFIRSFTSSLQEALSDVDSFDLEFDTVDVYCNDEETRTFIALKAAYYSKKYLLNITKKVDKVLLDYKLPQFYKKPSFHSSILWVPGNKKSQFEGLLDQLNEYLDKEFQNNTRKFIINKVHCKIGSKYFQYYLQ